MSYIRIFPKVLREVEHELDTELVAPFVLSPATPNSMPEAVYLKFSNRPQP